MTERVLRGFFLAQGARGTLLRRTHSEQGVSTVQYAFLVALVAVGRGPVWSVPSGPRLQGAVRVVPDVN